MNELEKKYLGKHLLVGLIYLDQNDQPRKTTQLHGIIKKISECTITFERDDTKRNFSIPFDETNLEPAKPGAVYKLKATGEDVEEVDFVTCWVIHPTERK